MSKKEGKTLVLFLKCFPENESSNHYREHTHYAFNVIRRQYLDCWVVGRQDGIAKQECSEANDNYSNYDIIDFHE
jgi:hypothetical protein